MGGNRTVLHLCKRLHSRGDDCYCGAVILTARLEVLPHAETCIECQAEVERS